jgi:predicted Holliday junction resolvase-like endonuclease
MKIGDKPISEMTESEMLEAIALLQAEREALRSDAIRRSKEIAAGNVTKEPKAPRTPKVKQPSEKDQLAAEALKMLMGDD